ncbi:2,3-bisphosphoglycerate-independent phosphoglycerate mutase [Natronogracilivirga saccharolytica]|uniref:2,3-bisphosphoglycerate-independent phosphoglycerate mutase n=1 Tax=Natronogracilivirga saccharolytica TaxID=2812953 RepID=A0A8J7RJZ9_9BACT|nr:2,3-bisphosphoglycerate-independent phosphoglycerate mutase [Natronogracilivirga saccharolytica]MBP3192210.1 2,3-bisphosphoglycerate-independent phosphoglycerate mutase [Natronogracilivirga saccharolytica]
MAKALLAILDGYGIPDDDSVSAIKKANTPFVDKLLESKPNSTLSASGMDVGLPDGQFGNSEVGHLNIGAGRIVWQELTRVNKDISDGGFFENKALLEAAEKARKAGKVHIMGLFSDGGVHSHNDHVFALLKFFRQQNIEKIYVHAFMDGRDTSPHGGLNYIRQFQEKAAEIGGGKLASIVGRYYAMDRDRRWERTKLAYDLLVHGEGVKESDPAKAVQASYDEGVTDEFIKPILLDDSASSRLEKDDPVVFYNIRGDRARQITSALTDSGFDGFPVEKDLNLHYVCFTQYDKRYTNVHVAYPPLSMTNTLGEVIAHHGLRQLRIAETEKYPHVTYFFNGGVEEPNEGEDRKMIPSPKVPTYDHQPEMSAPELTDELVKIIQDDSYDMIILNYANPDMVGHTGDFDATVKAVETIDQCLEKVVNAATEQDYKIIVISDHGNADKMKESDGSPHTAHTTARVPFIVINAPEVTSARDGILADVAPSLLKLMGISQPEEMDGKALI